MCRHKRPTAQVRRRREAGSHIRPARLQDAEPAFAARTQPERVCVGPPQSIARTEGIAQFPGLLHLLVLLAHRFKATLEGGVSAGARCCTVEQKTSQNARTKPDFALYPLP